MREAGGSSPGTRQTDIPLGLVLFPPAGQGLSIYKTEIISLGPIWRKLKQRRICLGDYY